MTEAVIEGAPRQKAEAVAVPQQRQEVKRGNWRDVLKNTFRNPLHRNEAVAIPAKPQVIPEVRGLTDRARKERENAQKDKLYESGVRKLKMQAARDLQYTERVNRIREDLGRSRDSR